MRVPGPSAHAGWRARWPGDGGSWWCLSGFIRRSGVGCPPHSSLAEVLSLREAELISAHSLSTGPVLLRFSPSHLFLVHFWEFIINQATSVAKIFICSVP